MSRVELSRRNFLSTAGWSTVGVAMATAATPAGRAAAAPTPRRGSPFPPDFMWGTATSAYQIEGGAAQDGRGPSVWDVFCKTPGKVTRGHTGDVACDHYNRYREDIALMRRLGVKSYRFSVSWSRVLPEGVGTPNAKGLDFYRRLVDEMLAADIRPMCTLFHWDFPQALYKRGGWLHRDVAAWFADYTAVVADALGDRISDWVTHNEPQVFIGMGHLDGVFAPGDKLPYPQYLTAAHNAMRAHGRGVQALRAHARSPRVGYVLSTQLHQPADPQAPGDVEAARWANFSVRNRSQWNNTWWTDPVVWGKYPEDGLELFGDDVPDILHDADDLAAMKQPIDFLGLNIYKAAYWTRDADGEPTKLPIPPGYPHSSVGWQTITPAALYWGPRYFHERYGMPMSITENGLATKDHVYLDGQVHDVVRVDYMHRALLELGRAIDEGIPVSGYYAWSLLDNFEWADGYSQRFGMVYVDFQTLRRIPKDSFEWYRKVIRTGGKSLYAGRLVKGPSEVTDGPASGR